MTDYIGASLGAAVVLLCLVILGWALATAVRDGEIIEQCNLAGAFVAKGKAYSCKEVAK
jgi:hypothetical protein